MSTTTKLPAVRAKKLTKELLEEYLKTLTFKIEGGNDSGWCETHTKPDAKLKYTFKTKVSLFDIENFLDNEITMNHTNYGSFAGNFNVYMTGDYDEADKQIVLEGEETDEETYGSEKTVNFSFKVPDSIKDSFREIGLDVTNDYQKVEIIIENGIWTDEHDKLEEAIKAEIKKKFDESEGEHCYYNDRIPVENGLTKFELIFGTYETTSVSCSVPLDDLWDRLKNENLLVKITPVNHE